MSIKIRKEEENDRTGCPKTPFKQQIIALMPHIF
jgi:hypothetical protein